MAARLIVGLGSHSRVPSGCMYTDDYNRGSYGGSGCGHPDFSESLLARLFLVEVLVKGDLLLKRHSKQNNKEQTSAQKLLLFFLRERRTRHGVSSRGINHCPETHPNPWGGASEPGRLPHPAHCSALSLQHFNVSVQNRKVLS